MADLKPPLTGYSLWFEAAETEQEFWQELIDDLAHEGNTRSFRAHGTLIGLLDKGPADVDQISRACREIAGSYRSVATEIIGVGMRDMYFQSVFLLALPTADLVAMNQQARKLLGHEHDPPFMPHWSALYGDFEWSVRKTATQRLLSRLVLPRTIPIAAITLVDVQGYPDEWKVIERYPFTT